MELPQTPSGESFIPSQGKASEKISDSQRLEIRGTNTKSSYWKSNQ
jgi:hypothetical protein